MRISNARYSADPSDSGAQNEPICAPVPTSAKDPLAARSGGYTRGLPGDLTTLRDRRKPAEQTLRARAQHYGVGARFASFRDRTHRLQMLKDLGRTFLAANECDFRGCGSVLVTAQPAFGLRRQQTVQARLPHGARPVVADPRSGKARTPRR